MISTKASHCRQHRLSPLTPQRAPRAHRQILENSKLHRSYRGCEAFNARQCCSKWHESGRSIPCSPLSLLPGRTSLLCRYAAVHPPPTSSLSPSRRSHSHHALQAASSGMAGGMAGSLAGDLASGAVDLDWTPTLRPWQRVLAFVLPAVMCAVGFVVAPPPAITWKYLLLCVGVYCMLVWTTKLVLVEKLYDARQQVEAQLAESDSTFRQVGDLRLHIKVVDGTTGSTRPPDSKLLALHLFHGFGANTFSWSFVQKLLAQRLAGIVTSHDQPGFGLTQRPSSLSSYLLSFNGHLGRAVLEQELAARSLVGAEALKKLLRRYNLHPSSGRETKGSTTSSSTDSPPSRIKRVLIGHSMGCISAALETISSPQDIEALILVAPGIVMTRREGKKFSKATLTQVSESERETTGSTNGTTTSATTTLPKSTQIAPAESPGPGQGGESVATEGTTQSLSPDSRTASAESSGGSMAAEAGSGVRSFAVAEDSIGDGPPSEAGARVKEEVETEVVEPSSTAAVQLPPEPRHPLKRYRSMSDGTAAVSSVSRANLVVRLMKAVVGAVQVVCVSFFIAALLPIRPILQLLLRNMVRSKNFWSNGLSMAYYNTQKVTSALVDGYRRPRLVTGFDVALLRFVASRATNGGNVVSIITGAPREDEAIAERLAAAAADHNVKVLIIHGENDKAIPVSNSRILAKAIKGAELVEVSQCGHVPHEELPECFVDIVEDFLNRRVLKSSA